jgi:hypothetical protein
MSGLYIVKNGAEYFLPSLDAPPERDEAQGEEDVVLNGLNALGDQITEYLNCFQLFGYDAKGRPVKLTRMSSYMEHSAIHGLINDELANEEMQKWSMIDVNLDEDDDIE